MGAKLHFLFETTKSRRLQSYSFIGKYSFLNDLCSGGQAMESPGTGAKGGKGGRGKEDEERETRKREDEKKGGKPHHKVRLPYL